MRNVVTESINGSIICRYICVCCKLKLLCNAGNTPKGRLIHTMNVNDQGLADWEESGVSLPQYLGIFENVGRENQHALENFDQISTYNSLDLLVATFGHDLLSFEML